MLEIEFSHGSILNEALRTKVDSSEKKGMKRVIALVFILGSGAACTNAKPQFSDFDSSQLPSPKFFGQPVYTYGTVNPNQDILVNGTCDNRGQDLEIRRVGASQDWTSVASSSVLTGAITNLCSSGGTFSFTVVNMTAQLGAAPSLGDEMRIELRSIYSVGPSSPAVLIVRYQNTTNIKPGRMTMTQGGQRRLDSATSFRAKANISPISGTSASSTNFHLNRMDR